MKTKTPGVWRRLAGSAFAVAAFLFLGYFVARNVEQLRQHEWTVHPGLLAASIALNIFALGWGVRVWQFVLRTMSSAVRYRSLARVWFLSGLGRYIPGKIWQFVGAAQLGGTAGLTATVTVASLAVHTGFFLIGAVLVAIYLVPSPVGETSGMALEVVRWIGPVILLAVHPTIINGALRLVHRATGQSAAWTGRWLDGAKLVLFSSAGWVVSGGAFYLFVRSLTPLPPGALPGIVGINALAFVVGYAVFIAPAGLGAKEGALTALLAFYLPLPVAVVVAIAARLWMVVAEIIPALILWRQTESGKLPEGEAIG
ncbi:MAG: lysylphosphatidylglycerol synthase domain-containing protein [Gemmatimonadota bacterium]